VEVETMQAPDRASESEGRVKSCRAIREEARPVQRILDRETRQLVGWLYEWNTGERMAMWKNGKREDVVYE
jgi:hypothetical protein